MSKQQLVKNGLLAPLVLCSLSSAVSAQNASPVLEEVVVTAQKREQSLQDVPISVVAYGREDLEKRDIQSLTDIGASVPNFYVNTTNNSPTSVRLFIRGIGQNDVQITQDPSVALYLDGVYIGTSVGAGFDGVDVERMEVLRGPQGTLYGRNATGGAVNIITKRANVEDWEFRQDFTAGNDGIFRSKTILNAPIAEKAAAKISYYHTERDGVVDNNGPGEDFGMKDNDSLVLDLRLALTEFFTLDYRYEAVDGSSSQRFEQVTEAGPGVLAGRTTINEVSSDRLDSVTSLRPIKENGLDIDGHSLFLDWEINDFLTAKSITSHRELDNQYYSDPLATSQGDYTPFGGVGAPSYSVSTAEFEQFSQELQLLGDTEQFNYVVGLYYYEDESEQDGEGSMTLAELRPTDYSSAENRSMAVFGQATYTPAAMDNRWHLTMGARYSDDNRKATRDNQIADFTGNYDEDFDNFNPSFTLAFDIDDTMNVYGKVVSGYKSGGTSQRSANKELFARGFDEEDVLSYELGFKGDLWNQRARFNAAVFHMELDGLQTSIQTGGTPGERDFLPIDDNTIDGAELDLTLLIVEGLTFSFNYGYLDTELGEDSIDTPEQTFELVPEMSYSPEHSYSMALDYYRAMSNGELGFNINYGYQDEVSTSVNDLDNTTLDDYGLWGAAISWSDIKLGNMPGSIRFLLWGKNLADEEYGTVSTAAWSFFGASEVVTFGDPRSYGLTASYIY